MTDVGDIPVAGIPLQTWEHGAASLYHIVGSFLSGGGLTAGQLKEEMDNVQWDDLDLIKTRLNGASSYLTGDFQTKLSSILNKLNDAYSGAANDIMASRFQQAQSAASNLAPTFSQLSSRVGDIDTALKECAKSVGGYSRFGSDVSDVTSHIPLVGGESQDDKARDAWNKCSGSFQSTGSAMPFAGAGPSAFGQNTPPTQVQAQTPTAVPTPGAVGPGPGPGGPTPQIAHIPTPKTPHPKAPPIPKVPPNPDPGHGPGNYGPGNYGPGNYGQGGSGPGGSGPGGYGPGGYGPGDGSGAGPGAGLDTGTDLAGYGPGPGPGAGPGPGLDGGGVGGGYGTGSDVAGSGAGGGAGGGLGGAAGGVAGAAGRGGVGGVPLGGRGGGGGGGSDSDRERSTWLNEDDDVWGESDAPDGVIS